MKNKFKALIAAFIGLFAFGAIAVGVNAATVTSTFVFDTQDELPKVDKNKTGTGTAKDDVTGEELTLSIANNMSGGSISWNSDSVYYFNRKSTKEEEYASFSFTSKGKGSITLTSFDTQSDKKYANISLTNSSGEIGNKHVAVKGENQVFNFDAADTYELKISGDLTQGSNLRFKSLVITYSYETASSDEVIVLFDSNGGSSVNSQTISINSQAVEPTTTKKGYNFDGWYTNDGSSSGDWDSKFDFTSSISDSITLYAKWTKNSAEWCTIKFDSNGGSEVSPVEEIYGSEYALPTATKEGFSFGGWNDGTNTHTTSFIVPDQETITLTAVWNEIIKFDHYTNFENGKITDKVFVEIAGNTATNKGSCVFNGNTYTTVLKLESSTSIKIELPYDATIYIAFSTSDSKNCKIDGTKISASTDNYIVKDLNAGTHTITKADTANIGFIGLIYNNIAKKVSATFDAQYNAKEDADSTKLRFIATIEGISNEGEDYKKIASIAFTFDFNGASRVCNVSYVYKSIKNGTEDYYSAKENTLYAIYTLNNVNKEAYKGLTLSNLQLVITYTDGSSTTESHADITLPVFTQTN